MSNISSIDSNMRLKEYEGEQPIIWHDPLSPPFRLSGFHWYNQDKTLRRLPLSSMTAIEKVNPRVNILANHTAGGQISFKTNSTSLSIKVTLSGCANMSTMTPLGISGFDCYMSCNNSPFYFEAASTFNADCSSYEAVLFEKRDGTEKEILLNMPLYNRVDEVLIGIDKSAFISPPREFKTKNPIVFYGTSITQGGCATRPGMAYTNIISRRLNANHINLGFSGNAFGEVELADVICEIKSPSAIIIDFEANGGLNGMMEKNLYRMIERIREVHAHTPVLVVSRLPYQPETHNPAALKRRADLREFQRNTVEQFKAKGDTNIFFLNGNTMLGDDFAECFVDAVHPTDLGFIRMADKLTPIIESMINNETFDLD